MSRATKNRSYLYRLDSAGRWSYARNPVDDPELARQFFRDIYVGEDGQYKLDCEGEICRVKVADAPSFVDEVELQTGPEGLRAVTLVLASGVREPLDPASLSVSGVDGALVCTDSRGLRTKFRRKPHLALAHYIHEAGDGRYVLALRGEDYEVAGQEHKP